MQVHDFMLADNILKVNNVIVLSIHIGQSRILDKTIFLACPYDNMNPDYLKMLHEHFDLYGNLSLNVIKQFYSPPQTT